MRTLINQIGTKCESLAKRPGNFHYRKGIVGGTDFLYQNNELAIQPWDDMIRIVMFSGHFNYRQVDGEWEEYVSFYQPVVEQQKYYRKVNTDVEKGYKELDDNHKEKDQPAISLDDLSNYWVESFMKLPPAKPI